MKLPMFDDPEGEFSPRFSVFLDVFFAPLTDEADTHHNCQYPFW